MSQQAWGIPFDTEEFIREAVKAGHPKAFKLLLPNGLDKAILENFSTEFQGNLIAMRAQWFKRWLHEAHVLEKLKHKRLLVWKAILADLQYTDLGVCDELFKGVQLVGDIPVTGIFDPCFKAAELTVEQLKGLGAQERMAAFYSSRTSGDDSVDREVLSKTMDEVSNNWARGPFSLDELPENIVISRRFGLKQTSKTRLIDDLSGSKINAAVQAAESPKPQGTDIIAAICLSMLQSKGEQSIKGRTFDMKSAYKQMPLAAGSRGIVGFLCRSFRSNSAKAPSLPTSGCSVWSYEERVLLFEGGLQHLAHWSLGAAFNMVVFLRRFCDLFSRCTCGQHLQLSTAVV